MLIQYKTKIFKAGTGQGKSYSSAQKALFETFTFLKTTIIATSSKVLVEQIHQEVLHLYNTQKIYDKPINSRKISIVQHTQDDLLESSVLLDFFIKGNAIIVTVHPYLRDLDNYLSTSMLNALTVICPSLVNILVDEANDFIRPCIQLLPIAESSVKHNDHLIRGYQTFHREKWSDLEANRKGFHFENCRYAKKRNTDSQLIIDLERNYVDKNYSYINFIYNPEGNTLIIKLDDEGRKECEMDEWVEMLKEKIYSTDTEDVFRFFPPKKIFNYYLDKYYKLVIYNSFGRIIKLIFTMIGGRQALEITNNFNEAIGQKEHNFELIQKIKNQMHNKVISLFFTTNLELNLEDEEKNQFLEDLNNKFNIYFEIACKNESLFDTYELPTANNAVLFLLATAYNIELTFYKTKFDIFRLYFPKNQKNGELNLLFYSFSKKENLENMNDLNFLKKMQMYVLN